jgi:hypothetical protein
LFALLARFDDDLASHTRRAGCPRCGGRLDAADYARKPRGIPDEVGDDYTRRRSFCCAVDGCRRRSTPPSVRFLGRKVFAGAVVVLAAALQHGPSKKRVRELAALLGVSRRTLVRWRRWWTATFPASRFWRSLRGRFVPSVDESAMPASLLVRMTAEPSVVALLALLAPISTSPGLEATAT